MAVDHHHHQQQQCHADSGYEWCSSTYINKEIGDEKCEIDKGAAGKQLVNKKTVDGTVATEGHEQVGLDEHERRLLCQKARTEIQY